MPLLFFGADAFISVFLTIGFLASFLSKEVSHNSNYIFFYNNGISKIQLWVWTYLMNAFFGIFITLLINLIFYYFE
ncbi:MAG TPA: hypothetical protein DIU01_00445 [Flavobacterium sp.]|nr:hypothetical protein [Flavobacterium sp.]